MEKLDFTPEEYRAYREEEGLGWPPQPMGEYVFGLIREEAERSGRPLSELVDKFVEHMRRPL